MGLLLAPSPRASESGKTGNNVDWLDALNSTRSFGISDKADIIANLPVDPKDRDIVLRWWTRNELHEPATLAAISVCQKQSNGGLFFDVGSNLGYFTLSALEMDSRTSIVSIDLRRFLSGWNLMLHDLIWSGKIRDVLGKLIFVNGMVSDHLAHNAKVYHHYHDIYEGEISVRAQRKNKGEFVTANIYTLDYLADKVGIPDYLKIDVEGHQTKAIRGMAGLLKDRKPVIIIELHDRDKLRDLGTSNEETVQPIFDAGYTGYWCGNHRDMDFQFEPFDRMSDDKDRLSLGVFVP